MWEGGNLGNRPQPARRLSRAAILVPGVSQGWVLDPTGFPAADGFEREIDPALFGEFDVTLKDGRTVKVRPVWEMFCEHLEDYYSREGGRNYRRARREDRGRRPSPTPRGSIRPRATATAASTTSWPSSTAATPWEPGRALDIRAGITGNWQMRARRCPARHPGRLRAEGRPRFSGSRPARPACGNYREDHRHRGLPGAVVVAVLGRRRVFPSGRCRARRVDPDPLRVGRP